MRYVSIVNPVAYHEVIPRATPVLPDTLRKQIRPCHGHVPTTYATDQQHALGMLAPGDLIDSTSKPVLPVALCGGQDTTIRHPVGTNCSEANGNIHLWFSYCSLLVSSLTLSIMSHKWKELSQSIERPVRMITCSGDEARWHVVPQASNATEGYHNISSFISSFLRPDVVPSSQNSTSPSAPRVPFLTRSPLSRIKSSIVID